MVQIKIQIKRGIEIVTFLKWWTRLVPSLASLWWSIPVVVVEVRAVFTGLEAVVPQVSIIPTNFAREERTHGVDESLGLLLAPFSQFLDQEVQLRGNHIRLIDGMLALRPGLESFFAPPLVGDHFLDQSHGFCDGHVEKGSSSSSIDMGS